MRRAAATVTLDQACASAVNLLIGVLVARHSSVSEYGVFALAFLSYTASLGLFRVLCGEPHAIVAGDLARTAAGRALVVRLCLVVAGIGVGLSVVLWTVVGVVADMTIGTTAQIVIIGLPLLAVRDFLRYACMAWGRASWALLADGLWLLALLCFLVAPSLVGADDASAGFAWGWLAAGLVTLAVMAPAFRSGAGPGARPGHGLRSILDLGAAPAVEFACLTGGVQVAFTVAAVTIGPDAVAGPRGGMILFGVTTVLFMGLTQAALVALARRPERAAQVALSLQMFFVLATVVVAVGLAVLPQAWGQALLGQTWEHTEEVLLPVAIYCGLIGVGMPALVRVRVQRTSKALFRRRAWVGLLLPLFAFAGSFAGASGFMWGLVLGQLIDTCIVQWHSMQPAARQPQLPVEA